MSKQTEALKLALKRAFNLGQTYWQQAESEYTSQWKKADVTLASFNQLVEDTIRKAQEEQPAQQEPVACKTLCELCVKRGYHFCANAAQTTPIPSPPASKPWVVLTDDEIEELANDFEEGYVFRYRRFTRAIEAKLKEKNHG